METYIEEIKPYGIWILIFVSTLILAEMLWSWRNHKNSYNLKDTFANISIFIGFQFFKILLTGYQLAVMGFVEKYAFFQLPHNAAVFLCSFIVADFIYYWYHRWSHTNVFLWAFHLVHHSSRYMNFTTAYRLHWFGGLINPFFYLPAILLGFPSKFLVVSIALNLFYQFFLHTRLIRKLGILEGLIDTPGAHRVHHGTNPKYIDKNFGGVFMVWDQLFETYQREEEEPVYGITSGFVGYNPFKIMVYGFKKRLRQKS